ncbi:MAG: chitobiase/beta-hexosaminidase C-terminal domain-containing protein, partial [Treponema sp.]|nr:chitobiase/beta-hexosaminidase C-terminal domain-containing protein [Treponema sp.]
MIGKLAGILKKRVASSCLFCALAIFFAFPAFSLTQEDILSPVQGEWDNVQALVIDNREPCGIYYSLTGSDPLVSGFAYDRPVVIEETGDVKIRITAVYPDSRRDDFTVEYTVKKSGSEDNAHLSEQARDFIDSICQNPLRNYISGDTFPIPKDFKYSFFNGDKPTIQGTELFIDKRNLL